jgi:hypothetical protein
MAGLGFDVEDWNPLKGILFQGGPLTDIYEIFSDMFSAQAYRKRMGVSKFTRLLPYHPLTGTANIGQFYLPGSYAVRDLFKAAELASKGFNPIEVVGQGIGIKVKAHEERTVLDDFFGAYHELENPQPSLTEMLRKQYLPTGDEVFESQERRLR